MGTSSTLHHSTIGHLHVLRLHEIKSAQQAVDHVYILIIYCHCQTETLYVQNHYFSETLTDIKGDQLHRFMTKNDEIWMKYGDTRFLPDSNDRYLYIIYYFDFYFVDLTNIS